MDEILIKVKAGKGGNGCVSFRRERFVPRGGPDGGDGGNGGSVVLVADRNYNTLYHLAGVALFEAEKGKDGSSKKRTGKSGEDCVVRVPVGTMVKNPKTGELLFDLKRDSEEAVVAQGGKGGRGNRRFATPERQAPRIAEDGTPGEEMELFLDLKLIADVGIIGMPNAGKSTLLARMSAARPKIAAYPFTTLSPNLGIVDLGDFRTIVMADIPGLIEGAHEGAGLGTEFLKHIERTRVLLHLIDAEPAGGTDPFETFEKINAELGSYSETLMHKKMIVVVNKMDLTNANTNAAAFEQKLGRGVLRISAATGFGIERLVQELKERTRQ